MIGFDETLVNWYTVFMLVTLMTTEAAVSYQMVEPGVVLFGLLLVLFGVSLTLVCQLKSYAGLTRGIFVVQLLSLLAMLGIVVADFAGLSGPVRALGTTGDLSETFAAHRWLLFQLPVALTFTNLMVLMVFREHVREGFSHAYRRFIVAGTWVSFGVILLIALESLI